MPAPKQKIDSGYKKKDGKDIKPIRYVGTHGDYIAGVDPNTGQMMEKDGRPIPYREIIGDKKPV